jgi:hypothetical protein
VAARDRAALPPTPAAPAASAGAEPVPSASSGTPSSQAPLRFDATQALGAGDYAALVERLVLEFPDLLRLESLGHSRGGRDVWLLTASDTRAGDPSAKPALCVCSDLPLCAPPQVSSAAPEGSAGSASAVPAAGDRSSAAAGPEAALYLLARVLSESRTKPEIAALLRDSTLYVLPAIDPEETVAAQAAATEGAGPKAAPAAAAGARACQLDRNFPVGWQPWGDAPGAQGPYPLSEPGRLVPAPLAPDSTPAQRDESACQRVCAMVAERLPGLNGAAPAPGSEADATAGLLHPPGEIARQGGDFASFCEEFVGLSVFATSPWNGALLETPLGPAPAGFESSALLVLKLLRALPRLAIDPPKVERLRSNLWMIDVGVHNTGILPTLSARLRARGSGPSVSLKTSGAKLVAVGLRPGKAATYAALRPQDGGAQLGHLAGEETFSLRALVEAPEGSTLEMSFESQRAGERLVKVPLQ